ncbi:MAG: thiamine pyrophosphate-binding protein [Holophaga sp.]|nr:thiamine pyrophosphate-binding protein [Holophaga sp.]
MKLSDYVMQRVAAAGVRNVFMLPGGGCMHLVDSLGSCPDLEYVVNLHEQGCAVAADAHAQLTGSLGVALVTTGPGGTNALTGVAASWLDSTPVLILSGQVKRADCAAGFGVRQMGFQEVDIVSMARPITKFAVRVDDPGQIRCVLDQAIHEATTGRQGPVWVDIPLDVQAADVDPGTLAPYLPPPPAEGPDLGAAATRTLDLLVKAQRPAILVGNGVRSAGAIPSFLALAERLGAPVLTTWKAADFLPETHPLFAGRPGAAGQRAANFTQQNADCLLVIGARLDYGQLAYMHEHFARGAQKIMVDIDPAEIRKMRMPIDLAVPADAGAFIRAVLEQDPVQGLAQRPDWMARISDWRERYPVVLPEYWEAKGHVDNYVLVDVISRALREGDVLVPGSSGACSELTCQAIRLPPGVRMLNCQGLGPMGFGIPAALGACVASGGRRTLCIDGDGGFQMNLQELEVIRRLNLPVKFFVLDNQGYGSIRNSQRGYFQGRFVASEAGSGLTLPDCGKVAEAFGIPSARLDSHESLEARVRELLERPGPLVCVVRISPDQATQPRAGSYQRADGSMATRPMEDLLPLLDRDELRSNMLIPMVEEP